MASYIPDAVMNPLKDAYDTCSGYWKTAHEMYNTVEKKTGEALQSVLPEHLKPLAQKVCKSIPETLFSASMITGKLHFAALIYAGVRLAWVMTPVINSAIDGDFTQEAMTSAGRQSLQRLEELYKRFKPAIALSCAVGSAVCTLFGTLGCNPSLIMQGMFLGLIGYMAYRSMLDDQAAEAAAMLAGTLAPVASPAPSSLVPVGATTAST